MLHTIHIYVRVFHPSLMLALCGFLFRAYKFYGSVNSSKLEWCTLLSVTTLADDFKIAIQRVLHCTVCACECALFHLPKRIYLYI